MLLRRHKMSVTSLLLHQLKPPETSPGGVNSSIFGMVLVSCSPPSWLPYQSFMSLQMPQVHWDTMSSWIISVLWVNGPLFRSLCQPRTRSCFLWWLHPTYVATFGLLNMWSFCSDNMVVGSASYFRAPRRILT